MFHITLNSKKFTFYSSVGKINKDRGASLKLQLYWLATDPTIEKSLRVNENQ